MPGPAPKHPSQRLGHRPAESWRQLPRNGRPGGAPRWPLEDAPTPSELAVWAELWSMPQAVVWEEQRSDRLVARYVLHLVAVEVRNPSTRLLAEVRQMEAQLLLAPGALAKARMEVAQDDAAERPALPSAPADLTKRRRLMAVDAGAVARA